MKNECNDFLVSHYGGGGGKALFEQSFISNFPGIYFIRQKPHPPKKEGKALNYG